MKSKIASNIIVNFISRIFIQVLNFISSIVLARIAGPGVLGNISVAVAFQNVFSNTLSVSIGNAHLKIYNEDKSVGIRTFAVISLVSRLIVGFLVIIIALILLFFGSKMYSALQLYLIMLYVIATVLGAVAQTCNYVFIARLESLKSNTANIIQSLLIAIFRIIAILIGFREYGITGFIMVATLLSIIFPIWQLNKVGWGTYQKKLAKKYLVISLKMLSGSVAYALLMSFDKMLLGGVVSDPKTVGFYTAGTNLGVVFMALGSGMGGVFLSVFSSNISNKNTGKNMEIITKYERLLALFVLPAFLLVLAYSDEIMRLFYGKIYVVAGTVFIFSVLHAFIKTQNIPLVNIYFSLDLFKKYNINTLLYSISIVGIVFLAALLNPLGSIISSVALGLFVTAAIERFLYVYNLRTSGYKIRYISQLPAVIIFVGFFIGIKILFFYFLFSLIIKLIIVPVIFAAIVLLMIRFKIYNSDDLLLIKQAINKKKKK